MALNNPNNDIPGLAAPTTHAVGGTVDVLKYNFNDTLDRDPFIASSKECTVDSNGTPKKDRGKNYVMVEAVRRKEGLHCNF